MLHLTTDSPSHNDQAAIYIRLIRQWWWLPVLFGLVSGGITYAGTRVLMKPVYGASLTMQVIVPGASATSTAANDASGDAVLLATAPVLQQVEQNLSPESRRDVSALNRISCSADSTDRFITCTTTSRDYIAAAAVLNDLARTFIGVNRRDQKVEFAPQLKSLLRQERALRAEIEGLQSRLSGILKQGNQSVTDQFQTTALQSQITQDQTSLSQLTVQESALRGQILQAASAVRVVDPASPSSAPLGPHPLRNAFLGLIIGIGVATALIVLLEYLDDRYRSSDELAEQTGLPVLSGIRRHDGPVAEMPMVAWKRPRSTIAESYRIARTNLQFASIDRPTRVLMVTSSRDDEGKTTTAANVAIAFATTGKKTLLVDCDLHRAGLSKAFDLRREVGISSALVDASIGIPALDTEVPNLRIVPSGPLPPNPGELLGSNRMREWVETASTVYDLVILDTPPILSVADTRDLSAISDGVVLVVAPEQTSRRLVRQARAALDVAGARTLGIVVNKVTFRSDGYYYSYNRYYYSRTPDLAATADVNEGSA